MTAVSITTGANEIASDGETTLRANVSPLAYPTFHYQWSIVKVDGAESETCSFATIQNATSVTATLKAANEETTSHTVTIRLTVSDDSTTKEAETTITVQAKADTTEEDAKAINSLTINGSEEVSYNATGIPFTAKADVSGELTLVYTWGIKENTTVASLSDSTTNTVTLTADNQTNEDVAVTITVTATDTTDSTVTKTAEFIVTVKAYGVEVKDAVTEVSISAAETKLGTVGTTTLTANAKTTGNPTVTYAWSITEGNEYATLTQDEDDGSKVTLTVKNTTNTAQTVKVSVTATYTADGEEKSIPATAPAEMSVAEKTLTDITIESEPTKTEYSVGETFSSEGLKVTANYSDDTSADVTDKVTFSGNTTTGAAESQTVTVTYSDDFGEKTAAFTISVAAVEQETVSVTGVTLDKTTLTLSKGETAALVATVAPADATDKSVTWESSDENVATVAEGVVTAIGAGNATITVTTTDGAKTATATVTVGAAYVVAGKYNLLTKLAESTGGLTDSDAIFYITGTTSPASSAKTYTETDMGTTGNIFIVGKCDSNGLNTKNDGAAYAKFTVGSTPMYLTFVDMNSKGVKIVTEDGSIKEGANDAVTEWTGASSSSSSVTLLLTTGTYKLTGNAGSSAKIPYFIFAEAQLTSDPNTGISAETGWLTSAITLDVTGKTATVTLPDGVTGATYAWRVDGAKVSGAEASLTLDGTDYEAGKSYVVTALVTVDGVTYDKSVTIIYQ